MSGHLLAGIIMIVVGVPLMLNGFYKWFPSGKDDRDPKDYNIMHALTPDFNPGIRIFLGIVGAIVAVWGAYLVISTVGPGS